MIQEDTKSGKKISYVFDGYLNKEFREFAMYFGCNYIGFPSSIISCNTDR